jgi:O-acetyl-ADP-ribose deacetylase (regulator of RNase III)
VLKVRVLQVSDGDLWERLVGWAECKRFLNERNPHYYNLLRFRMNKMTNFQFISDGNIFLSFAEALVNPVNCVGVMGKGLAKQFKVKFPDNFKQYKEACDNEDIMIGRMNVYWDDNERVTIFNFPTKVHWRNKSQYRWIDSGLNALRSDLMYFGIRSVAIPPLGCGLGGLEWSRVRDMIIKKLDEFNDLSVKVYEP